jgi:hypothetical protein
MVYPVTILLLVTAGCKTNQQKISNQFFPHAGHILQIIYKRTYEPKLSKEYRNIV